LDFDFAQNELMMNEFDSLGGIKLMLLNLASSIIYLNYNRLNPKTVSV